MITKPLIAIAALLAFTAASGLAYAGPQPSDKAWWPRAASGQTTAATAGALQQLPASARIKSKAAKPDDHRFFGPRGFH
jgi:hypothetical protein